MVAAIAHQSFFKTHTNNSIMSTFNNIIPVSIALTEKSDEKSDNHATIIGLSVVILITLLIIASVCFAKQRQESNPNKFRQKADADPMESVEIVSKQGRFMVSWNTIKSLSNIL